LRGGWSSPRVLRQAVLEEKKSPWLKTNESTSRSGDEEPLSVSVIIPVHNEVATIATLVEKVGDVMQRRGGGYEIICVDDGSTDGECIFVWC
jgi:cellulose synthase/poly-beta-1,6-N-acetylglucosamine synthase-like glycosyltransferase